MGENQYRVLVIDDDRLFLKSTAVILSGRYSVSLAAGGTEALRLLKGGSRPDIILLDVSMPSMDGFETMRLLRLLPGCTGIPVVFLTGMTDSENELKGLLLGAVDYIRKPFSQEVLFARLDMHLKNALASSSGVLPPSEAAARQLLNDAEWNVVHLICKGYSGKEISEQLFYSYSYVKKLMASAREKLGVESTSELRRKVMGGG